LGQPRPLRLSLSRRCVQLFFLALLAPAALTNPVPADELSLLSGADAFERYHGLVPSDPNDRNGYELSERLTGDAGYTNLETYLDAMSRSPQPY